MITQLITNDAVTGTARPSTDTANAANTAVKISTAVGLSEIARALFTRMEFNCRPSPVRVIIGPALQDLGVAAPAAAMFVFYFAVLSEVTPPTALASVAASAITGGRVIPTMMQTWKYTLPAFLVPFAFVLTNNGEGMLGLRSIGDMVWTAAVGALAVAALAVVTGGWLIRKAGWPERLLCAPAAALLLYLHPVTMAVGAGLLATAVVLNLVIPRRPQEESLDQPPADSLDTADKS